MRPPLPCGSRFARAALLAAALLAASRASRADTWTRASPDGFGKADNAELQRGATYFDGSATFVYFGVKNSTVGAQVWRSSDGFSWNQANASGFDASGASNTAVSWLASFNGALLAAVASTKPPQGVGARLFRSPTGADPWTLVFSTQTAGSPNNASLGGGFAIFQDRLYVGTVNGDSGAELWRTDTASSAASWVQVSTGGFSQDASNQSVRDLLAHAGELYAAAGGTTAGRGQIWRSTDGASFSQVLVASNTFSANTLAVSALESFQGRLYAGTLNGSGAQLWRADAATGAWTQLFTSDGDGAARFSVAASSEIRALKAVGPFLYSGTWDPAGSAGTRIYRSTDGLVWVPSNFAGFGSTSTQWTGGFVGTATWVYAGTRDDFVGGGVWRSSAVLPSSAAFSGSALGVSSIAWSWGAAADALGFKVVTSTGGELSGDLGAALSWTETGLSTNTAYSRSVTASNALGASTSTALTVFTRAAPSSGTAITGVFGSSITLSWNANTNPGGTFYRIRFWQTGASTDTVTVAATNGAATGLFGGTTYFLDGVALNGDGVAADADVTVTTVTPPVFVSASTIAAGGGAVVIGINSPAGLLTVSVPASAFDEAVALTIQVPAALPATTASPVTRLQGTGVGVQIDPNPSVQPVKEITLDIPYLDANIAGMTRSRLIVARFDPARSAWVPLPSTSDAPANRVTAVTNHLSLFQLMQALPADSVSDVKAFPNPLQPALGHARMTFSNLPADARVRLYTLLGELVKDLHASASGIATWDGTNESGERVASGVYYGFAEGAGGKKTFTVAVQR